MKKSILILALILFSTKGNAQENSIKNLTMTAWDGTVIIGYVNNGAFINFGGPSLKLIHKPYTASLGFLPSLRIKEDKVALGQKKNSIITPTLGFGLTSGYKHLAFQIPAYYNSKTGTKDGKWNIGLGLGYKF